MVVDPVGPAAGDHIDQVVIGCGPDGTQHHQNDGRIFQLRQCNIAETLPLCGSVHAGRLIDSFIDPLEGRPVDQHGKGVGAPDVEDDHHPHGGALHGQQGLSLLQPPRLLKPMADDAVLVVEHPPGNKGQRDGGHDVGDQQKASERSTALHGPRDQQRDSQPQGKLPQHRPEGPFAGIPEVLPEQLIVKQPYIIVQPDKLAGLFDQRRIGKAQPDVVANRIDHKQDQKQNGGEGKRQTDQFVPSVIASQKPAPFQCRSTSHRSFPSPYSGRRHPIRVPTRKPWMPSVENGRRGERARGHHALSPSAASEHRSSFHNSSDLR